MKPFWWLVAAAVIVGSILIGSGATSEWSSSLFSFAFTFSLLRIYFLPSSWHAGLGMGLSVALFVIMSGEVTSSNGLALMSSGLVTAAVCFYHVQRDYPLRLRKVN